MSRFVTAITYLFLLLWAGQVSACPMVSSLVDYNCNGDLKIAITGDSIVRGVGDTVRPRRGYPGRLRALLPGATVSNLGVPGVTSGGLLRGFKKHLNQPVPGATQRKTIRSDIIVIAVGVNDYWAKEPASRTVTNIRRLVRYLRTALKKKDGVAPLVVVATLTPNGRDFQQPFVTEVNRLLLKLDSSSLPVDIRFDLLEPSILSADGLHPDGAGYDVMATLAAGYLTGEAQELCRSARVDSDDDGIYDLFEIRSFQTDPTRADSDGDTVSDGDEVFTHRTDPLNPDTDGDGVDDGTEIVTGSDPLAPPAG